MKSDFFIDRPVFSTVISIIIVLVGLIGLTLLPVDQYPKIVPPVVSVSTSYPGANSQTVSQAVATPIEQSLNGTPGMLYMESSNSNSGWYSATLTFDISTDPDLAAVEVQNRVKLAESRLPAEVVQNGISVEKESSSKLMTITIMSDDPKFDEVYLSNYTTLNIQDRLRRVAGVGGVSNVGSRYYAMQIWVQPDKMASLGITVKDLQGALKDQNREAAAGVLGQQPITDVDVTIPITAPGRLSSVEEFENIVVRTGEDGAIIRLKDVARVSLEAQSYNTESGINARNAAVVNVYMLPGANAMEVAENVRAEMEEISASFPEGMSYNIPFDMTTYISESIHHVYRTLFEALFLVILVVFLSLQNVRATLVPAIAVPISLIGTFGVMLIFGFSLNMMTLLGLILAIGIVVDDAIVVVENVDRIMTTEHLSPYEATKKAMREIGGALVAMSLVLCAVFVPVSFLSGITGQLFRQFTVTIAVSVIISTVVALTLSPVMCSKFLKPHGEGGSTNFIFNKINLWMDSGTSFFTKMVRLAVNNSRRMFAFFGIAIIGIFVLARIIPQSFIPKEDQGYFTVELELPMGATLERTRAITDRAMEFLLRQHDVDYVLNVTGSSPRVGTTQSGSTLTVILKPWNQRKVTDMTKTIAMVRDTLSRYPESRVYISTPPVIPGLGTSGGFSMVLEARGDATYQDLQNATDTLLYYASKRKELTGLSSGMQADIPQLYFDADRDKIQLLGLSMADVFATLKAFTGAIYVNDFNMYNRIYRVYIQADAPYRAHTDNLNLFFMKSSSGTMIPVNALGNTHYTTGPGTIKRFNMYNSSTISGEAANGVSSGDALAILQEVADEHLPDNIGVEWSGMSYQEKKEGGQTGLVLALALLFVFLFLAAQYESWLVPVAVILSLPIAIAGAYLGIAVLGMESNIYFQIGLVMLVGLVAKNAILIVEFAKEEVEAGKDVVEAAVTAAKLRFRPIVMTSLAFILGMLPLVFASGPGSESRQNIGTGVFFGMIVGVSVGIVFVPFFFVTIYKMRSYFSKMRPKMKNVIGGRKSFMSMLVLVVASALTLNSCSTSRYCQKPDLGAVPQSFSVESGDSSIADLGWKDVFKEPELQKLIETALTYNKDVLIAAERLNELRYKYRMQKASQLPAVSAKGYAQDDHSNYGGTSKSPDNIEFGVKASLSWEVDFWGRLKWASREKLADYLAAEDAQKAVKMSIVASVASAYYELVGLDRKMAIVTNTMETRRESVKQAKLRAEGGLTSEIPYQQALVEFASSKAMIPDLEKQIALKESELCFITGSYPGEIARSVSASDIYSDSDVPTGVLSDILKRRPDLMASRHSLKAAEARVGVSIAERFPTFVINLGAGLENDELKNFLKSPFWFTGATLASPIFEFGKRKAAMKAAISSYEQSRLKYEKDVLQAFREVYDATVSFQSARSNSYAKSVMEEAAGKYITLANSQYINGVINYIDVLDAQRKYLSSQIEFNEAKTRENLALVGLYKALGGGWN